MYVGAAGVVMDLHCFMLYIVEAEYTFDVCLFGEERIHSVKFSLKMLVKIIMPFKRVSSLLIFDEEEAIIIYSVVL